MCDAIPVAIVYLFLNPKYFNAKLLLPQTLIYYTLSGTSITSSSLQN